MPLIPDYCSVRPIKWIEFPIHPTRIVAFKEGLSVLYVDCNNQAASGGKIHPKYNRVPSLSPQFPEYLTYSCYICTADFVDTHLL